MKLLEEEKQLVDTKVVNLDKARERNSLGKSAFQVAASIVLVFSGYLFRKP